MSFYLDTNVVVSLFRAEAGSAAAVLWLRGAEAPLLISDFGTIEFAAVLSREVRTGAIEPDQALGVLARFDIWRSQATSRIVAGPADMQVAETLVRDFATKLQAPDALHLALAMNARAALVTLDKRLAAAAEMRGVAVVRPE